jgi:hypothetical protein
MELMLLSFTHRFLFVHVYKVAGTSVMTALQPYAHRPRELLLNRIAGRLNELLGLRLTVPFSKYRVFPNHIKARELRDVLPARIFDRSFKFAFVRNPWDWQVSLYHFMLKKSAHSYHQFVSSLGGFADYLRWRVRAEKRLQKDFLTDERGNFLVDFVGRFERLEQDFRHICQTLNLDVKLPRLNQSPHRDYRSYYDSLTRELVATHFREDIEAFGYTFDNDLRVAG